MLFLLLAPAVLYLLTCAYLFLQHRAMLYFPQPRQGAAASVMNVELDGQKLKLSARPLATPAAVLYFGGNGEDVSLSLEALAAAFPGKAVYLVHYRGYGGSEGKPTEAGLVADALALFDRLQPSHPQITVIGRSLGSGVAVHLASVRPVQRLVLVTPFNSIAELAQQRFPMFPVQWLMLDKYDSWRHAPKVRAPTTLVIASDDEMIPRASAERLFSQFQPGVASKVIIKHRGHNSISDDEGYLTALSGGL